MLTAALVKVLFDEETVSRLPPGSTVVIADRLLECGRLLVFVDGLDEAGGSDAADLRGLLADVQRMLRGESRVLLTSRTSAFGQPPWADPIADADKGSVRWLVLRLSGLRPEQVDVAIRRTRGGGTRLARLKAIPGLAELARRPILLPFVIESLGQQDGGGATLLSLYDRFVQRWLEQVVRHRRTLSLDDRFRLMDEIAWNMYEQERSEVPRSLVDHWTGEGRTPRAPDAARRGGVLVRTGSGQWTFAHRSYMEYFVAKRLVAENQEGRWEWLARVRLNDALRDFLRTAPLDEQTLRRAVAEHNRGQDDNLAGNVLTLLHDRGASLDDLDLSRRTIRRANLVGADLRGLDFRGSRLVDLRIADARLDNADMSGVVFENLNLGVKSLAKCVATADDAGLFAAGVGHGSVESTQLDGAGQARLLRGGLGSMTRLAFTHGGRTLVGVDFEGQLTRWATTRGDPEATVRLSRSPVYSVAVVGGADVVLAGDADGTLHVRRLHDLSEVATIKAHKQAIYGIGVRRDERALVTASFDKTAIVWRPDPRSGDGFHVESWACLRHDSLVNDAAFGRDLEPERVYTVANDGQIRAWNTANEEASLLGRHDSIAWTLAVSPDGGQLATGSSDRTVAVRDSATGALLATFDEATSTVWSVAFARAGQWVVVGCDGGSLFVWEWRTGRTVLRRQYEEMGRPGLSCKGLRLAGTAGLSKFQAEYLRHLGATFEVVSEGGAEDGV